MCASVSRTGTIFGMFSARPTRRALRAGGADRLGRQAMCVDRMVAGLIEDLARDLLARRERFIAGQIGFVQKAQKLVDREDAAELIA